MKECTDFLGRKFPSLKEMATFKGSELSGR